MICHAPEGPVNRLMYSLRPLKTAGTTVTASSSMPFTPRSSRPRARRFVLCWGASVTGWCVPIDIELIAVDGIHQRTEVVTESHADTEPSLSPEKNTGPRNGWKSVLHGTAKCT